MENSGTNSQRPGVLREAKGEQLPEVRVHKAVEVPRLHTWMPSLVILWHIRMGLSAF